MKVLTMSLLTAAVLLTGSWYPGSHAYAAETRTITAYTTTPQVAAGGWAKVAGFLSTSGGGPVAGGTVYLQYKQDNQWHGLAATTTRSDGYYQFWFKPWGDPMLRTMAPGPPIATSGTVSVQTYQLSAWRSKSTTTFWGWVKIHGVYKDGLGNPISGQNVHVQLWDYGSASWNWSTTAKTSGTGYYVGWARPWATSRYRVATDGSARVSAPTTVSVKPQLGLSVSSSVTNLGSQLRFYGWLNPTHIGHTVYFQKYNSVSKRWEWISSHRIVSPTAFSTLYQFRTFGWHAFRLNSPAHWDHLANVSKTVWVKVVR